MLFRERDRRHHSTETKRDQGPQFGTLDIISDYIDVSAPKQMVTERKMMGGKYAGASNAGGNTFFRRQAGNVMNQTAG